MPSPFAGKRGPVIHKQALPGTDGSLGEREALEQKHAQAIKAAFDGLLRQIAPPGTRADTLTPEIGVARYREHSGPLRDALVAMLTEAGLAGAELARLQVETVLGVAPRQNAATQAPQANQAEIFGADWTLINQAVLDWVLGGSGAFGAGYGNGLAAAIARTSEELIRTLIAEWMQSGQPLAELIGRLEEVVFSRQRADMIATTEVTRAFAEGNTAAWQATGIITQRQWQTAADERVCPICGPLQGVVVGMDEPFPGDLPGPPAHPHCRCWLTPVVTVEEV